MHESLYRYSDDELSLRVFNDEALYIHRHTKPFISYLESMYQFTNKQLAVLKADLVADKAQDTDIESFVSEILNSERGL